MSDVPGDRRYGPLHEDLSRRWLFPDSDGVSRTGGKPFAGQRYSIHDLVVDDIDGPKYGGTGLFAQLSNAGCFGNSGSPNQPCNSISCAYHAERWECTFKPRHEEFRFQ